MTGLLIAVLIGIASLVAYYRLGVADGQRRRSTTTTRVCSRCGAETER